MGYYSHRKFARTAKRDKFVTPAIFTVTLETIQKNS